MVKSNQTLSKDIKKVDNRFTTICSVLDGVINSVNSAKKLIDVNGDGEKLCLDEAINSVNLAKKLIECEIDVNGHKMTKTQFKNLIKNIFDDIQHDIQSSLNNIGSEIESSFGLYFGTRKKGENI